MAQVTAYSDLYKYMYPLLPGLLDSVMLLYRLRRAGREFCQDSEAFEDELEVLPVVDYQQDYTLSHSYDASIHRILWAKANNVEQSPAGYDLEYETTLRWQSDYIPHDVDNMVLQCATAGVTALADWQAVTDGSVKITVDTSTHSLTGLDFSTCSSMEQVAQTIQTALRVAAESNTGFVRWWSDHFSVWVESGTTSYLTAGATGTDISGTGYMNGLTGGSATLDGSIATKVVFRPEMHTDTLPDWFLDRWAETIMAHALSELLSESKKPWSNPEESARQRRIYNTGLTRALKERKGKYKNVTNTLSA